MGLDTALLRASLSQALNRMPDLGTRFYALLFERYPETRRLFGGADEMAVMEDRLIAALRGLMYRIDDAPTLTGSLEALGARHVEYGVTDEMYDGFGECLLATVAEALTDEWTSEVAAQWVRAWDGVQARCLRGARAARAEQESDPAPSG